MTTKARWVWGISAFVIASAFVVGGYLLVEQFHLDGGLISALFTALAAIAAGVTAFAAFLSAQQSSAAARDTLRALSLAGKPAPAIDIRHAVSAEGRPLYLRITNPSLHPIDHAVVSWTTRDGAFGTSVLGYLDAADLATPSMFGNPGTAYQPILIAEQQPTDGVDQITLDYWGTTGAIGWRLTKTVRHEFTATEDGNIGYRDISVARNEAELA